MLFVATDVTERRLRHIFIFTVNSRQACVLLGIQSNEQSPSEKVPEQPLLYAWISAETICGSAASHSHCFSDGALINIARY